MTQYTHHLWGNKEQAVGTVTVKLPVQDILIMFYQNGNLQGAGE